MKEDDFTKEILVPLFKSLGYSDTHFSGGSYEEGKDLIAVKEDPFDGYDIAVCQTKKYRGRRNKTDRQAFGTIIYQLRQCFSKEIPCKDGIKRLPRDVFFITPYILETRLISEQFEQFIPSNNRVRILDGAKLYNLIQVNCPFLLDIFSGLEDKISHVKPEDLINHELFAALNISDPCDYSVFYNDLNFFVGSIDSNILLNSTIEFSCQNIPSSDSEWKRIKEILTEVNSILGFDLLLDSFSIIEQKYNQALKRHLSKANQNRIKTKCLLEKEFKEITDNLGVRLEPIKTALDKLQEKACVSANNANADDAETYKLLAISQSTLGRISIDGSDYDALDSCIANISAVLDTTKTLRYRMEFELINDLFVKLVEMIQKYKLNNTKIISRPIRFFRFNKLHNDQWLKDEMKWYSESIGEINSNSQSSVDIRNFIGRVDRLLYALDLLISKHELISNHISITKKLSAKDRLKISAHSIFDSGENIAVYGEAGAGKTTTLQMYAYKRSENTKNNELILYLPLNRISIRYKKEAENLSLDNYSDLHKLYASILLYKEIPPSKQNIQDLEKYFSSVAKIIFIFDALDEAVKEISWLLKSISSLKKSQNQHQVIASTRDCVDFIDDINFLGITLLPFTRPQLEAFIRGWIKDDSKSRKLIDEVRKRNLFDVAKNPLLATIICTLYENGINAPECEADVYRKKIELLCGQYDQYKGIKRLGTPADTLLTACRKIAYAMHERGQREASISTIKKLLEYESDRKYSSNLIDQIVKELINPCNILQKDSITELYGFGHLRYQEFLASEELTKNRGIDIVPLLNNAWWRGAFYLYAFENRIDVFLEQIYNTYGYVYTCEETIRAMISARPKRERKPLTELLDGYLSQDRFDGYISGDYEELYEDRNNLY